MSEMQLIRENELEPIDSDYKDQIAQLLAREQSMKLKQQELQSVSVSLASREETLKSEANKLLQKEIKLTALEIEAKNGFPKLLDEKFREVKKSLEEKDHDYSRRLDELNKKIEAFHKRELKLREAEDYRDRDFLEQRQALDRELHEKKRIIEKELSDLRQKRFSEVESDISKERTQRLDAIGKELADSRERSTKELNGLRAEYDKTRLADEERIKREFQELSKLKADLSSQSEDIEYERMRLKSRQDSLIEQEMNLDAEITRRISERKKSFDAAEIRSQNECERLRESLERSIETLNLYEELKRRLGNEEPEQVLLKLSSKEEELKKLRVDLLNRPSQEMQHLLDRISGDKERLEHACQRLSEENKQLKDTFRSQSKLEIQISDLSDQNKSLTRRFESVDADNSRLSAELKRLQACYEREEDREERIRDIEAPYFIKDLDRSSGQLNASGEIEWLDRINNDCVDYGIRFPKRILRAYHTALKTAEWSPLTVLAGVSGTGKSELPRLYSHFGGIKFLNLAVQPNWDSQESMLGFFNSIDNKFDAQPVLRLLAQSQKLKSDDYPAGLQDAMCMILLDEMNLAHVELYFAEFLSKLELRRGMKGMDVPKIEVKLGAGIKPYELPLGRNILWTGTMNQDETTKTLSDKVLDRGIVIHFPRPTTLERRSKLKDLKNPTPLLSRKLWQSWWCRESKFEDKQIMPFKGFIEETNTYLAKVGRALGHRVWQSIEYYMANYPDVLLAQRDGTDVSRYMKIAFEDQLVQKVMPKLRGIETRGRGKNDCLDRIREQLINDGYDSLLEDFDSACEFGYGQFMWHSANYLKDSDTGAETSNQKSSVAYTPLVKGEVEKLQKVDLSPLDIASISPAVEEKDYSHLTPKQQRMMKDALSKGKAN